MYFFQSERGRRQAEQEAADHRDAANELSSQCQSLNNIKRKLEAEMQAMHVS